MKNASEGCSDAELSPETADAIVLSIPEGAALVHKSINEMPDPIVAAIDQFVYARCGGKRSLPDGYDPEDLPYSLGALWGEQLVREFNWTWRNVTTPAIGTTLGVISPDKSLVVYPVHYLFHCLARPDADPTILLAFNMLSEGKTESQPNDYRNLMTSVLRIVPRGPYGDN